MLVREIHSKSVLSVSKIFPYVINPYVGCQHNCSYCYARFMKRFSGHTEPWGQFVDVKIDAPALLQKEVQRKHKDRVWISGVCDPYQPLEARYQITRHCLQALAEHHWPVTIQTRSPLVCRDLDILSKMEDLEVGLSITTADDAIRCLFEPQAPSIPERIAAMQTLHQAGIRTFVMIAPILPCADGLPEMLAGSIDTYILDRMNYHYADWVYHKNGMEYLLTDEFFDKTMMVLSNKFEKLGISRGN